MVHACVYLMRVLIRYECGWYSNGFYDSASKTHYHSIYSKDPSRDDLSSAKNIKQWLSDIIGRSADRFTCTFAHFFYVCTLNMYINTTVYYVELRIQRREMGYFGNNITDASIKQRNSIVSKINLYMYILFIQCLTVKQIL